MGSSTWSDIVENVADIGLLDVLIHQYETGEFITLHGWTLFPWKPNDPKSGRKKSLYADLLIKGEKKVFLLNTSPYSNGGDYEFSIYSADRSAVEEFLKDWSIQSKIDDMDSVCQTL